MARDVYTATISNGEPSLGKAAEPNGAVSDLQALIAAIDYTTFATDLATLVADGASPTQAHVTAVNDDWTALKALIDAVVADNADTVAGSVDADVTVLVNLANVVTKNALRKVFNALIVAMTNNASGLT